MDFKNISVKNYLRYLSDKKPAPGGGSAAALTGACGVALILKALAFSSFNKDKLNSYILKLKKNFSKLTDAITEDGRAYAKVVAALKLPRRTSREITQRKKMLRKALIMSSKVSHSVIMNSKESLKVSYKIESYLNKNFISDITCARILLKSAASSSEFFFNENLKYAARISKKR